jgi:hypothetical protein
LNQIKLSIWGLAEDPMGPNKIELDFIFSSSMKACLTTRQVGGFFIVNHKQLLDCYV